MLATKEKIVVVEDEKDLARLIRHALAKERFRVTCAADGESGLKLVREIKPDLIVLDIMLPKMDGLELLRVLRPETAVPIMMLTAKRSEMDRILGLKLGADDYIVKPFSIGELQARIERQLRRAAAPAEAGAKTSISLGELEVDFERHETKVAGKSVHLAPKEFAILRLLMESNGKVLSRDKLLELIWGHDQSMEIDTRTVDQHIARLRRKLGCEGARVLTVTNFGYQVKMR
ncbi:MAG: response regulator transcription factor [Elusimicrobia bacterium]|nr:response regulator transcription factor [Elusimicrobiota bacterium]